MCYFGIIFEKINEIMFISEYRKRNKSYLDIFLTHCEFLMSLKKFTMMGISVVTVVEFSSVSVEIQ